MYCSILNHITVTRSQNNIYKELISAVPLLDLLASDLVIEGFFKSSGCPLAVMDALGVSLVLNVSKGNVIPSRNQSHCGNAVPPLEAVDQKHREEVLCLRFWSLWVSPHRRLWSQGACRTKKKKKKGRELMDVCGRHPQHSVNSSPHATPMAMRQWCLCPYTLLASFYCRIRLDTVH